MKFLRTMNEGVKMESLRKSDLIVQVAEKAGISKADAGRAIEALQETIIDAVANGKKVTLTGFVSFDPSIQSARNGRNPRTGEELFIPERKSVRVRPLKAFKEALV